MRRSRGGTKNDGFSFANPCSSRSVGIFGAVEIPESMLPVPSPTCGNVRCRWFTDHSIEGLIECLV